MQPASEGKTTRATLVAWTPVSFPYGCQKSPPGRSDTGLEFADSRQGDRDPTHSRRYRNPVYQHK
jgi:hypothetical protein